MQQGVVCRERTRATSGGPQPINFIDSWNRAFSIGPLVYGLISGATAGPTQVASAWYTYF